MWDFFLTEIKLDMFYCFLWLLRNTFIVCWLRCPSQFIRFRVKFFLHILKYNTLCILFVCSTNVLTGGSSFHHTYRSFFAKKKIKSVFIIFCVGCDWFVLKNISRVCKNFIQKLKFFKIINMFFNIDSTVF